MCKTLSGPPKSHISREQRSPLFGAGGGVTCHPGAVRRNPLSPGDLGGFGPTPPTAGRKSCRIRLPGLTAPIRGGSKLG
jgi:hypothetical protein